MDFLKNISFLKFRVGACLCMSVHECVFANVYVCVSVFVCVCVSVCVCSLGVCVSGQMCVFCV